jgi:hypothetical protein
MATATPADMQQRARETALLEKLIADCTAALAGQDPQAKADALIALTDFQTLTTDPALIRRAEEVRAAAAQDTMTNALKKLAAIAARLDPLGATLADCAKIAKDGKANLLFPRVAASAEHMLQITRELQKTAESLKTSLDNVNKLSDVPDAIQAVATALEQLKLKAGKTAKA